MSAELESKYRGEIRRFAGEIDKVYNFDSVQLNDYNGSTDYLDSLTK
jgi:hypothetical protein